MVVVSLAAFHHSVGSVLHGVATGSVVVYVLAVPVHVALAAVAIGRRTPVRPPDAVRPGDVLLGAVVCLVAVGTPTLLGPGLTAVYGLWRVDLLMLWLFLLGATVLCFGLRQVVRA